MIIKKLKRLENTKLITFDDESTLEVSTSARVKEGDEVVKVDHAFYVKTVEGDVQVYPSYSVKTLLPVGGLQLPVEIKEPTTAEEFKDVEWLGSFHYLGEACLKMSTLIVTTSMPNLPHTLGCAILATGLNACSPRTPIVKALLSKELLTMGRYMPNWFAMRINRVIVHPEFRGTGVAKLLVEYSIKYCRDRVAIIKHKPLIIEICAMMLKYAPFVNKYMTYLGETATAKTLIKSGNVNPSFGKKNSGMQNYHENYLKTAREIASKLDVSVDKIFDMVLNSDKLDIETRVDIQKLLHSPKPFYALGLNDKSNEVVKSLAKPAPTGYRPKLHKISSSVLFKDIEVTFEESAKATERTLAVQEAFGISPRGWVQTVLKDFTLEIKPGEIVLLTGISGSGKSIVLRAIQNRLNLKHGFIIFPKDAKVSTLDDAVESLKCGFPLIDCVGKSIEEAFYTLNRVGLGEAKLYMKSYATLSTGQKYRACIAKLIDSDANIWIADEFGSTLDIITANVVASSVQRHCRATGITFIAACANPDCYLTSLKPDYVIDLSAGRTRIIRMNGENE